MEENINIENINDAILFINKELDNFDPKINYKIEEIRYNEDSLLYTYKIDNREFLLSFTFTQWLINLQTKYLWPKKIFNIVFLYSEDLSFMSK
jgi:hypothetical protein